MESLLSEEVIYSLPFSVELFRMLPYHPELEVMIAADGTIYYARPSHQEFLIRKAMERNHCSRDELMEKCPQEYHANFMVWLIEESGGYIPVWRKFFIGKTPTKAQKNALKKLKLEGLYRGKISCGI